MKNQSFVRAWLTVMLIRKSVTEIPITSAMLKSCKLPRVRYATALKEKKEKSDGEIKNRKQKLKTDEIAQVKEKKKALELCIESLIIDIEKYIIAAEKEADLSLLTKGNSFRVTVHKFDCTRKCSHETK